MILTGSAAVLAAGTLALVKPLRHALIKAMGIPDRWRDVNAWIDLDRTSSTGALDRSDLLTLTALGDVLIPSSFAAKQEVLSGLAPPPPDSAQDVIQRELKRLAREERGYLAEFRVAAEFLDALSSSRHQTSFSRLPLHARCEVFRGVVEQSGGSNFATALWIYLRSSHGRGRRLWLYVAQPILKTFYSSAAGWSVVGYNLHPGECSNLVDYGFPMNCSGDIRRK